jgi:hypothetical protein
MVLDLCGGRAGPGRYDLSAAVGRSGGGATRLGEMAGWKSSLPVEKGVGSLK